jgi:6,7-dimethyl-8-ribityllumazine synthase
MPDFCGATTGTGLHIAIVTSDFAEKDGGALQQLRETCWAKLTELGATYDTYHCPGAFEIPTVVRRVIDTKKYAAIVTLGVVVRGETAHFDLVANGCMQGIAELGRTTGVPVIFGVLTTYTTEQAVLRGKLGAEYAEAAVQMATLVKRITQNL